QRYSARLTFFIAYFDQLSAVDRASLHQLASDGHDIEAHSVKHLRGPVVVEDKGLATYMAEEVQPSIDRLVADGYSITTFAYPYGARTEETDRAILDRALLLRSVSFAWSGVVSDPCPY